MIEAYLGVPARVDQPGPRSVVGGDTLDDGTRATGFHRLPRERRRARQRVGDAPNCATNQRVNELSCP